MIDNPVQRAADAVGGRVALAEMVNVTPAMVHQWLHGIRQVSAERCPAIERATGGQVRCEDLRPDVDWAVLRCQCADTPDVEPVAVDSTAPSEVSAGEFGDPRSGLDRREDDRRDDDLRSTQRRDQTRRQEAA